MNAILDALLDAVVQIAAAMVSAAVLVLIKYGISYLQSKTRSEKMRLALTELEKVVADGVAYTEQTLVTTFKNSNTWSKETQHECLTACVNYIIANLSQETTALLISNETDIRDWATAQVEAYIQKSKLPITK